MAIKARLRSVENRIGVVPCECQSERWDGKIEVVTLKPGQTEPPPQTCPKCGRSKLVIVVKYVEQGTWRALGT